MRKIDYISFFVLICKHNNKMVKNTKGGSGHKNLARKNVNSSSSKVRFSENEFECYALVTTMLGDGRCKVTTFRDNRPVDLICVIRGKFRGRNKSHNLVSPSSIVLVGIRDWSSASSVCDLLEVYSHDHLHIIRSAPHSYIPLLDNLLHKQSSTSTTHDFDFDFHFSSDTPFDPSHCLPNPYDNPNDTPFDNSFDNSFEPFDLQDI